MPDFSDVLLLVRHANGIEDEFKAYFQGSGGNR